MKTLRSRFEKEMDKSVQDYTASIRYDIRLYKYDIAGSIAHANMLARQGIITEKEADLITTGLVSIQEEIEQGEFQSNREDR
jgi:argininosuccinate lyase